MTPPSCCWRFKRRWSNHRWPTISRPSDPSRVARVASVKITRLISNYIYLWLIEASSFWAWALGCPFQGSSHGSHDLQNTFPGVFATLLQLRNWKWICLSLKVFHGTDDQRPKVLKFLLSVKALKVPQSDGFFLGEGSFRDLLTVATWKPNFSTMASREQSLEVCFIWSVFFTSFRPFPRPIVVDIKSN